MWGRTAYSFFKKQFFWWWLLLVILFVFSFSLFCLLHLDFFWKRNHASSFILVRTFPPTLWEIICKYSSFFFLTLIHFSISVNLHRKYTRWRCRIARMVGSPASVCVCVWIPSGIFNSFVSFHRGGAAIDRRENRNRWRVCRLQTDITLPARRRLGLNIHNVRPSTTKCVCAAFLFVTGWPPPSFFRLLLYPVCSCASLL